MTGVLLLSKDGYYATATGDVSWGPASDKAWLRHIITNEIVIVGHETFRTIRNFDGLICLPKQWLVDSRDKIYTKNAIRFCKSCHEAYPKDLEPTINFGGPKNMLKFPPDKIIVNTTHEDLGHGLKLPDDFFDNYEISGTHSEPEYEVTTYEKKK